MGNVKKILVPIDFSPESAQALRDANALAREIRAQLIALHVIDEKTARAILLSAIAPVVGLPFLLDVAPRIPLDVLVRERTLDLWNFVEHKAGRIHQDKIAKVVRIGRVANEISRFLGEEDIDLMVVKLRPKRLFPDFTTLNLVKIAGRLSCPVLLEPPADRAGSELRKGLFAWDLFAEIRLVMGRELT